MIRNCDRVVIVVDQDSINRQAELAFGVNVDSEAEMFSFKNYDKFTEAISECVNENHSYFGGESQTGGMVIKCGTCNKVFMSESMS